MGTSGGGKTTVLRLIGRQLTPMSGQVLVGGQDMAQLDAAGLKAALLVGAVLGLCVQTPVLAAQAKKAEQTTSKKSIKKAPVAAKSSLPAAKSAGKSGKTVASRPGKAQASNAGKAPTRKVAAAGKPSAKAVRQVMMDVDGDPRRLALYSASALVVDQSNGQALVEKQPDAVVPIASISKLMTAMVVLDAKLDLQEVIAIGDEDVDGLKGTRSRLPVGTSMTRETAMLLALMWNRRGSSPIGRGSMSLSGIGSSSNASGSISKSSRNQQKGNNTYVKQ
jgi:D-alanyl-D-alanine endopeptidase (penicillin-binding protein 7)